MAVQQIQGAASPAPAVLPQRPAVPDPASARSHAQAQPVVSAEQVRQAVKEIEKAVAPVARDLQFSIDNTTGKTVITVMDSATKEVIRQIPTEEALSIARAVDRMLGVLVKQKA